LRWIARYLGGYADSPDNIERRDALAAEVEAAGATLECSSQWQGYYFASGGAKVIRRLLEQGRALPRAIVCANDQTGLAPAAASETGTLRGAA
jgi:LacI family transcriptional regulator